MAIPETWLLPEGLLQQHTGSRLPNTKCGIRGLWHLRSGLNRLMLLLASVEGFRRISKQLLYVCV